MYLHRKESKLVILLFVIAVMYCITAGCLESQNLNQEKDVISTEETSANPEETNQPQPTNPSLTPRTSQDATHYQNGLMLFNQSRYLEAIDEFNAAIALNSSNYDALYYRARSYYQIGYHSVYEFKGREELQNAIDDFTGVIQHSPSADAYSRRGFAKIYLGRLIWSRHLGKIDQYMNYCNDAIDDFSEALSIDPNSINALNGRAMASYIVGEGQGYKQAGYIPVNEALLESGRRDIEKSLRLNASDATGNWVQSIYYMYDGNLAEARKALDKAIESDPHEAHYYVDRGIVRRFSDDHSGAIEDYSMAIKLQPRFSDAYNYRGILRDWMKVDNEGIISDFNKAIEINPEIPVYYDNYAWALVRLKAGYKSTFEDALVLVDKAIELDPLAPSYHLSKGFLLTWLDRGYEACEEFNIFKEYSNTNEDIQLADSLMHEWSNYHAIETYGYFLR